MIDTIASLPGNIGFYYKNLVTGKTVSYQPDAQLKAASVIKLPMMIEAFRQFEAGMLSPDDPATVRREDKVPPSGVLTFLHDGLTVSVLDLVTLMIIVSDNTATNILMDILGIENVNNTLASLGAQTTRLRRKMYDREGAARGLQNHIAAGEIGMLLEKLYLGQAVSPESDAQMIDILKAQQVNGKIPARFCETIDIAHKTGEDSGITHDVGIVYAETPFILCCCSNNADVPAVEGWMRDLAWELAHDPV